MNDKLDAATKYEAGVAKKDTTDDSSRTGDGGTTADDDKDGGGTVRLRTLVARMSPPGLKITVEINAEFPEGASDQIKRAVSENATSLEFGTKTWG